MKKLIFLALITFCASCAESQGDNGIIKKATSNKPGPNEAVATFAEGCFWHSEIVFQSLEGVRDAVSGYCGGNYADPDYEKVSTGTTGHAETVQVYYDSTKISYETLVKAFFTSQNPTEVNRQGNDAGTQYRSVAFYRNDRERNIIQNEINRITASKQYDRPIATQVVPFKIFYPAEAYHQEYIANNPGNSYVQGVSIPDFEEFKKAFKGPFKK